MKNCLIRIPVYGLLRATLWAAWGIVCFASAPAMAWDQNPRGVCADPRGCELSPGTGGGGYTGPSPEEQKRQREAKDSREASDDAYDKGIGYYDKGDWQNAAKYFREALEYSPDDQNIRAALGKAEQKAREQVAAAARASEAARQLKIVEMNSRQAKTTADSQKAKIGFDTGGKPAGTLAYAGAGGSKEPVVPASKRTPAITALETQRNDSKKQVQVLDEKLKKLDPVKDTVAIAKVKQEKSTVESKVQYLNFSIGEMLDKLAQDTLNKPTK